MPNVYKIRFLIACVSSTIVLISSVYNVTAAFATKMVHDIILDETRQLELSSNLLHSDVNRLRSDQEYNQTTATTTGAPCKDSSPKYPAAAANPKFDKRYVKRNEIDIWSEIEQILSPTKDMESSAIINEPKDRHSSNDTIKSHSKPKRQPNDSKGKVSKTHNKRNNLLNDTTIIITTNWMPSVPSTAQLDKVIHSLTFLQGFPKDAPMIIAVDGAYESGGRYKSVRNVDMRNYIKAIKAKYNQTHIKIVTSSKKVMLVRNMKRALRRVHTKFVLVLQHDLPFINKVNYTGLIDTMGTHPEVRLVRFPTARVLTRKRDGGVCDEKELHFESENGIQLSKTHVWSDRNHLTRKSYYDEMFALPGWNGVRAMEFHMQQYGKKNCSYWGTYLYGAKDSNPTIFHMDGRRDGRFMTSTKRVYGNLTGIL